MSIRFDMEQRIMELSVGDLVHGLPFLRQRGTGGIALPERMAMGTRAHREIQTARAGRLTGYRSEVPVKRELSVSGYRVTVQGRIDGCHEPRTGELVVEEIKSVILPAGEFSIGKMEPRREHTLQLEMYCSLMNEPGIRITGLLIFYNLADGSWHEHPLEVDPERTAEEMERRAAAIIDHLERAQTRLDQRREWAGSLAFPFAAMRTHQDSMVKALAEAWEAGDDILVSAPAGTGKTAAALFAALAHAFRHGLRLYYVTAKTTQQTLAAETLETLAVKSGLPVQSLVLRAKDRMCLSETRICNDRFCPHIRQYPEKIEESGIFQRLEKLPMIRPENILEAAGDAGVCPFEVSLDLAGMVDAVVCDYNYVFDPAVALMSLQEGSNRDALLVVDEAHNLLERGRDYYSPALEYDDLATLAKFLAEGRETVHRRLEGFIIELEALLETIATGSAPDTDGPYEITVELNAAPFEGLKERLDQLVVSYLLRRQENDERPDPDDPVLAFANTFNRFTSVAAMPGAEFVNIHRRRSDGSKQLRIFCLDPSRQLGRRIRSFAGTAAMSATLEPHEYYRQVLGFRKTRTRTAGFPSPFPAENRMLAVIPEVSTTYRDRPANYRPITRIIKEIVSLKEANYLVFFPSFAFLERIRSMLRLPGSTIIRQTRDMSIEERSAVLEQLSKGRKNRLVLAVQGGIFAEGVDYPGDMAAGVIVVGPGLPQVSFERSLIRRHFEEQAGAGFNYAYLYPGMNRAIQSAGRLIRRSSDRGIIVLLGRRFATRPYADCFPAHWYDEHPGELVRRDWWDDLARFWDRQLPLAPLP